MRKSKNPALSQFEIRIPIIELAHLALIYKNAGILVRSRQELVNMAIKQMVRQTSKIDPLSLAEATDTLINMGLSADKPKVNIELSHINITQPSGLSNDLAKLAAMNLD